LPGLSSEKSATFQETRDSLHGFHLPCLSRTLRFRQGRRLPPARERLAKHSGDGSERIVGLPSEGGEMDASKSLARLASWRVFLQLTALSRVKQTPLACVWVLGSSPRMTKERREQGSEQPLNMPHRKTGSRMVEAGRSFDQSTARHVADVRCALARFGYGTPSTHSRPSSSGLTRGSRHKQAVIAL